MDTSAQGASLVEESVMNVKTVAACNGQDDMVKVSSIWKIPRKPKDHRNIDRFLTIWSNLDRGCVYWTDSSRDFSSSLSTSLHFSQYCKWLVVSLFTTVVCHYIEYAWAHRVHPITDRPIESRLYWSWSSNFFSDDGIDPCANHWNIT